MISLRENLILERKKRDLTRVSLAESIGISSETVKKLENGDRNPGRKTAIKLAEFYGKELDYLFPDIFLISIGTKNTKS